MQFEKVSLEKKVALDKNNELTAKLRLLFAGIIRVIGLLDDIEIISPWTIVGDYTEI